METQSTASMETQSTESDVLLPSSQSDIRRKFLQKLSYSKIWVPQALASPKHQTVTIFDWDDTLLCTTWLRRIDPEDVECSWARPMDAEDEKSLQTIVQHSKNLLETAIRAGRTYIITNAMSGWVEYSAARWAPELLPVLRKVTVISARSKFEASFPDDARQWKIQAFLEVQRQLDATPITNLVALGDAQYEIDAARIMGKEFNECLVKTVKFQPDPSPAEHRQQLKLVDENLEKIIGTVRDLSMRLETKF